MIFFCLFFFFLIEMMVFDREGDAQLGMEPGYSEFQEVNTWLNTVSVLAPTPKGSIFCFKAKGT